MQEIFATSYIEISVTFTNLPVTWRNPSSGTSHTCLYNHLAVCFYNCNKMVIQWCKEATLITISLPLQRSEGGVESALQVTLPTLASHVVFWSRWNCTLRLARLQGYGQSEVLLPGIWVNQFVVCYFGLLSTCHESTLVCESYEERKASCMMEGKEDTILYIF